jgi:hypothetical protein
MKINKFNAITGVLMAAVLGTPGAASAATVNFDVLRSPVYMGLDPVGTTYTEAGLTFSAWGTDGRLEHMAVWGYSTHPAHQADPTGASVWVNSIHAYLEIQKIGGTFDLNSLDLADYLNMAVPFVTNFDMAYSYVDAGGEHTGVFKLDQTPGLQTFTVNLKGVSSFKLYTGGSGDTGVQIDNVRFDESLVTGVPEPASWAMMLLGFGGLGALLRQRRSLLRVA